MKCTSTTFCSTALSSLRNALYILTVNLHTQSVQLHAQIAFLYIEAGKDFSSAYLCALYLSPIVPPSPDMHHLTHIPHYSLVPQQKPGIPYTPDRPLSKNVVVVCTVATVHESGFCDAGISHSPPHRQEQSLCKTSAADAG